MAIQSPPRGARSTRVSSSRFSSIDAHKKLGLLHELAGTWKGYGFNLTARPDFHDNTDVYLQLNHTRETLTFTPIGSPIPNRGFGQDDIELFGLTYLQQISDRAKDGALHIEPGIWVTQPSTDFPSDTAPANAQLIARMGTIPHGNSILAQGIAEPFSGTPVLSVPGSQYNGSRFPSFNSTPFAVPPTAPEGVINAAGSSERLTAATVPATPFPQYDLSIPVGPIATGPIPPGPLPGPIYNPPATLNTRTPYETVPLDPNFDDTPENQALVNDPIVLLQNDVQDLVAAGYTFEGTVLNVATQTPITFLNVANSGAKGATTAISVPQFGGGVENVGFLSGQSVDVGGTSVPEENAQTALVYATFWIEKVSNADTGDSFTQLQYAQMVLLNFPIRHLLDANPPTYVNLAWPHITVGTLKKDFG